MITILSVLPTLGLLLDVRPYKPIGHHQTTSMLSLKRQLFDFQSAYLRPDESQVLRFSIKETLKSISIVTPFGDRVVRPGAYTIQFSRGHGTVLEAEVRAMSYYMVRKFPSPWVDMHEVVG
jgi:hypothetical protein